MSGDSAAESVVKKKVRKISNKRCFMVNIFFIKVWCLCFDLQS